MEVWICVDEWLGGRWDLAESYCVDKFDSDMLPLTCRLNDKYQFKDKELVVKINHTN